MKTHLFIALRLTLAYILFFCVLYTAIVWGIGQFTTHKGKVVIETENSVRYAPLVGQAFLQDTYFWARPSAVDYNAAGSGGSNKGPTNPEYLASLETRIDSFLVHNPGIKREEIPAELITASGSGLDPHISLQAAQVQVKRIALARHLSEVEVKTLVSRYTEPALWGLFGPVKINVLLLNQALDSLQQTK